MMPSGALLPGSDDRGAEKQSQRTYWDQRLRQHWGPQGVGSLAYGRHYNRWLYRVRRRALVEICRAVDMGRLHEARVLDVGCGTGFYIGRWRALGVGKIAGLDFSSVAIAGLRKQFPDVTFYEADIGESTVPLSADSFDVVGAFDVLYHVVDDERYENALRNISTLLRRGGVFLYSDNFIRGSSQSYLDYWKARSLHDIERSLDKVGFQVLDRIPVFVLMNSPVDSQWPHHQRLWDLAMKFVRKSEAVGFLLGAALYPFELLLRKIVCEGPSTEIMVCRKR